MHEDEPVSFAGRDMQNYVRFVSAARAKLESRPAPIEAAKATNLADVRGYQDRSRQSLATIAADAFQAMVECVVSVAKGRSSSRLCYVNKDIETTEIIENVPILPWTDPIAQIGLTFAIGEQGSVVDAAGAVIKSVQPQSRGEFEAVVPALRGLYTPGGRYPADRERRPQPVPAQRVVSPPREMGATDIGAPDVAAALPFDSGHLRSVKLQMTKQQVEAFIAKPRGYLLIQGAPGTGKTTIALQRIRFLFDLDRSEHREALTYSPASTIVFVPNHTFVDYVGELMETELSLPRGLIAVPETYVQAYLRSAWLHRHGAATGSYGVDAQKARTAYFGLCNTNDLKRLWYVYEDQISRRLLSFSQVLETEEFSSTDVLKQVFSGFAAALRFDGDLQSDPHDSQLRLDGVFRRSARRYEALRTELLKRSDADHTSFDRQFRNWLYWVYDPLDALATYFLQTHADGVARIGLGIGDEDAAKTFGDSVKESLEAILRDTAYRPLTQVEQVLDAEADVEAADGSRRYFGAPERAWLAWLLRNALPEQAREQDRFARLPRCFIHPGAERQGPWHHLVLDEAQDLTVAEAAFLSSLVHQRGALTVSADFHQAVSPVRGIDDDEALRFGSAMHSVAQASSEHEFSVNLRQSKAIADFLRAFYRGAFGQRAPFNSSQRPGGKPVVVLANRKHVRPALERLATSLKSENGTVAVIGIDYNERQLKNAQRALSHLGAQLFTEYLHGSRRGGIVIASAEQVKGHEFSACIIRGLEDVERTPINHSKNRAYVALSRAMDKLWILATEEPQVIRVIGKQLYTVKDWRPRNQGQP